MQFLGFPISKLSDLSAMVSIIGTVGTTAVAVFALSSWNRQLRASDRRKLSHSIFDELTEFVRLNRKFRAKCENWHYNEHLQTERDKIEAEINEALLTLERSLVKLYLLSDITEERLKELQSDLHGILTMVRNTKYGIQDFYYSNNAEDSAKTKMQSMMEHLPFHADALREFQTDCMALLKVNFT